MKSDLDIRPVYHKTDDVTKAHLNLAVLAYWIVSTTEYKLKESGSNVRREEPLRIMSAQQRVTMVAEGQRPYPESPPQYNTGGKPGQYPAGTRHDSPDSMPDKIRVAP